MSCGRRYTIKMYKMYTISSLEIPVGTLFMLEDPTDDGSSVEVMVG